MSAIFSTLCEYIDPRFLLAVGTVGVLGDRLLGALSAEEILELEEEPILVLIPLVVPSKSYFTAFLFDETARGIVGEERLYVRDKLAVLEPLRYRALGAELLVVGSDGASLDRSLLVTKDRGYGVYLADDVLTSRGLRSGGVGVGLSFPQEARGMRRRAARASARVRKMTFFMLVIVVR